MTIGRRIKEIRQSMGLTQEKFAEACDLSVDIIAAWERDKYKPRKTSLCRVANNIGMTFEEIMENVQPYW